MKILIINGPNMNMLGIREKNIYGNGTYDDLVKEIQNFCDNVKVHPDFFQSNHEGEIIDEIQKAYQTYDGIVINPAGYTHTSVAILDALKAVDIPTVEVHLSDVDEREEFRKVSYISTFAKKVIKGRGFKGYIEAIEYLKGIS